MTDVLGLFDELQARARDSHGRQNVSPAPNYSMYLQGEQAVAWLERRSMDGVLTGRKGTCIALTIGHAFAPEPH